MTLNQQAQAIINAMTDAVLIVSQKTGQIIDSNEVFIRESGIDRDNLAGLSLLRLPQLTRQVRHGLISIYIKAVRQSKQNPIFNFQYITSNGEPKDVTVSAVNFEIDDLKCILFKFVLSKPQDNTEEFRSQKAFLSLTEEAWLEFRPLRSDSSQSYDKDEAKYLKKLGSSLFVYYYNEKAKKLYERNGKGSKYSSESINNRNFLSFFSREDEALRFLDMLSSVGQLRAAAIFLDKDGNDIEVELSCSALFDDDDNISSLYCIPRDFEEIRRCKALLTEIRAEQNFWHNQPFLGIAHLVPMTPIERPKAQEVEDKLTEQLSQIRIINVNKIFTSIYALPSSSLLLQPITRLFASNNTATQVLILKELFVTRQSSFAEYDEKTGRLIRVLLFKASFDDADRLIKIFVAASPSLNNFAPRHDNLIAGRIGNA